MKILRGGLVVAILLSGCTPTYVKPNVSWQEHALDWNECKQQGVTTTGGVLTGLGILLWPLLAVGIPMIVGGHHAEYTCMKAKGYEQES